jgi:hypothetical protein
VEYDMSASKSLSVSLLSISFSIVAATALSGCPEPTNNDAGSDATSDVQSDRGSDALSPSDIVDVADDVPPIDAADVPDVVLTDASDVADANVDAGCAFTRVIVGVSDYASFGGYVIGDLATRTMQYVPAADAGTSPIDQDHNLRSSTIRCETYDLWHSAPSHVVTIDPANPIAALRTADIPNVPTGADGGLVTSNPYDIAVITPTKAYVAQYNSADLLVIDPSAGTITRTISLAQFADADGIPEAASITVVGAFAYVAVQQLDRASFYTAPAHSHLAVVDTATDMLVDVDPSTAGTIDAIELTHGNPSGNMPLASDGRQLLVTEIGNYGDPTGGIDVIDTMTNTVARTIENADLGGKASSAAWIMGHTAWASVDRSGTGSMYVIVSVNAMTGAIDGTPIASSTTYSYGSLRLAPDGNSVWAIGGDYNAGSIHAFSTTGTALLTMPFTTGMLNTTSLEFLP